MHKFYPINDNGNRCLFYTYIFIIHSLICQQPVIFSVKLRTLTTLFLYSDEPFVMSFSNHEQPFDKLTTKGKCRIVLPIMSHA